MSASPTDRAIEKSPPITVPRYAEDGRRIHGTKVCRRCGEERPLSDYCVDRGSPDGLVRRCIECRRATWKRYHAEKRDEILERKRAAYHADVDGARGRARVSNRKSTYGLTDEDFQRMNDEQGGRCHLCGGEQRPPHKALAIDHDHACCSGRKSCGQCVRRLLCTNCNHALGHAKDDPDLLRRMADYVEDFRG